MKKIIILAVFLTGTTFMLKAQDPMFVKGDKVVSLGVGLTSYANAAVMVEIGIIDGIIDKGSIGAGVYAGAGINYWGSSVARFVGGVRGAFHYPFIDKFDTYIGLGVGLQYRYWFYLDNDIWPDVDGFIGARYRFSERLSFYGELGASLGYISGGICVHL